MLVIWKMFMENHFEWDLELERAQNFHHISRRDDDFLRAVALSEKEFDKDIAEKIPKRIEIISGVIDAVFDLFLRNDCITVRTNGEEIAERDAIILTAESNGINIQKSDFRDDIESELDGGHIVRKFGGIFERLVRNLQLGIKPRRDVGGDFCPTLNPSCFLRFFIRERKFLKNLLVASPNDSGGGGFEERRI